MLTPTAIRLCSASLKKKGDRHKWCEFGLILPIDLSWFIELQDPVISKTSSTFGPSSSHHPSRFSYAKFFPIIHSQKINRAVAAEKHYFLALSMLDHILTYTDLHRSFYTQNREYHMVQYYRVSYWAALIGNQEKYRSDPAEKLTITCSDVQPAVFSVIWRGR